MNHGVAACIWFNRRLSSLEEKAFDISALICEICG
jgi:hypothetical protein